MERKRKIKLVICIGTLLCGLILSVVFMSNYAKFSTSFCPTQENFTEFWNNWSYNYLTLNIGVDVDTQMEDWNALMFANNCGDEWLDPLDDLINDYLASTTINKL